jgi:hypothetical protein
MLTLEEISNASSSQLETELVSLIDYSCDLLRSLEKHTDKKEVGERILDHFKITLEVELLKHQKGIG